MTKKAIISFYGSFLFAWILFTQQLPAQSLNLEWVRTAGGDGYETGVSMHIDSNKYLYTAGSFQATFDFDPGPGVATITSQGSSDIYIAKLDTAGRLIWVKQFGGPQGDAITNMTYDAIGNLYLTGHFQGTVDFDPGPGVFNMSTTIVSSYILKLDRNGIFTWARQIDAGNSQSIAVDTSGNVITSGEFGGTVDFDPGPGIFNATPSAALNQDLYIVKLNRDGNFVWMKQLSTNNGDFGDAWVLRTDPSQNIYLAGNFGNTFDFNPGTAQANLTALGSVDIFILKLDRDGNYIWAKQMGGTGFERILYMELDAAGNIFSTGGFSGTVDFDPGTAAFSLNAPVGIQNPFISKLDNNGNFVFAKNYACNFSAQATGLALDVSGDIYTVGSFMDSLDVDPGPGVYKIGPFGIFISRLSASGNFNRAGVITTNSFNYVHAIRTDILKNIYTTSTYGGSPCDFDPGPGVVDIPVNGGAADLFIHKVSQCKSSVNSISVSGCGSYTLNGTTYTSSGSYYQTLVNAVGCDSIIALNVVINSNPAPNLGKDSSICSGQTVVLNPGTFNSYLWSNGGTGNNLSVTTTGSYWVQVTGAGNCTASDTVNILPAANCPDVTACQLTVTTRIYPNPFRTLLVVDKNVTTCAVKMDLYNALGQLLMRGITINDGRNDIPLSRLPAGVYFYKFYADGKELLTGKIMKQ